LNASNHGKEGNYILNRNPIKIRGKYMSRSNHLTRSNTYLNASNHGKEGNYILNRNPIKIRGKYMSWSNNLYCFLVKEGRIC